MAVPLVRFVQDGGIVDYTPAADTAAGTVVVQGVLVGVTKLDIRAGHLGALAIKGIFDFPKAPGTGLGIAAGARCYWDATNGVAVASAGGGANAFIGKAVQAAADADTTVRVALGPGDAVNVTVTQTGADAVADDAAITATAAPAGGTGTAAGGWDTAAHRDAAIAAINATEADVTALRTTVQGLLASLRTAGVLAE
jgi:predicted RecA/RadA family phage recombinase